VGRQEREADDGADERARAARTEATMSGLSYEAASEQAAAEWDDMSLVERLMALPGMDWPEEFADFVEESVKVVRIPTPVVQGFTEACRESWLEKRINELMEGDPDGDYEREHDV
jgi:hypothetical protein